MIIYTVSGMEIDDRDTRRINGAASLAGKMKTGYMRVLTSLDIWEKQELLLYMIL